MGSFIALYRGVNVVGKKSVKMERLRAMHERLGHREVRTDIRSGNVVFAARGTAAAIARKTAAAFADEFGFAAKVLVVDAERLRQLVAENPYARFAAEDPKTVHVGICDGAPDIEQLKALRKKTGGPESFVVRRNVVYLHAPDGYGTSKFAAGMERASGVAMTVRNWRTIEALTKSAESA